MPNYNPTPVAGVISLFPGYPPGTSPKLFNAEQPAVPQAGQQVAIGPGATSQDVNLSVEGFFSGAPGTFELDVQTADTDSDQFYENVPGAGVIIAVDSNNHFRAELPNIVAKFARPYLRTRTNAVNLTVWFTR